MGLCVFLCTSLFMYAFPALYMQLHFMQLLLYCCCIFFTQVSVYIHLYTFHNSHTILYWAFYALHFLPIYPWVMFLSFFLFFLYVVIQGLHMILTCAVAAAFPYLFLYVYFFLCLTAVIIGCGSVHDCLLRQTFVGMFNPVLRVFTVKLFVVARNCT